ncbi:DUF6886 family protein [Heyndrickxia acidicola]|uniref:Uncharacterized protein n=1 Tax=Heyndrickxia acidicola TaxID=209389 RepID=A0ABU6MJ16_9BACI|nr:DUF6886 family protein [Heyndrickxia acidicola]MED1204661.1 hypothetical protein [Heyndrickxia acidicola]
MLLYHFSEDPSIKKFVPLPHPTKSEMPPVVWAIDEEHAPHYFFPRDCPRVVFSKSDKLSKEDERLFFSQTSASKVIAVESRWISRIQQTTLYQYTFDSAGFELYDAIAGYYISRFTAVPLAVEPLENLLDCLTRADVELRITPDLNPLRDEIISSTLDNFSIIRFQNASKR